MRSTERARPSHGGSRPRAERGGIRVATWNIRAAIGPGEPFPPGWWRHVRRDRFERIAAVIRDLDADVIGLQEVALMTPNGELVDQPADLASLTDRQVRYAAVHAYAMVEPEDGRRIGAATWGNALLTGEPLREGFAFGLPLGEDAAVVEPAGSGRQLAGVAFRDAPYGTREPRCLVGGRMPIGDRGDVWVLSTHFAYAGAEQRRAQAAAVAACIGELDGPVVLLGDLNARIEDADLEPLRSALDDAFTLTGILPGDVRRRSCGDVAIDHILVRGLRAIDCRVDTGAGDASDHLPVVATLEIA